MQKHKKKLNKMLLRCFASSNARKLLSKPVGPKITINFFFVFVSNAITKNHRRQLNKCGGSWNIAEGETVAREREE